MDGEGLEGFIDSFLFLTILSVASCVVLTSVPAVLSTDEQERRDAAIGYASSSLDAILASTIPDASYPGCACGEVGLANDSTVKELLLGETYLGGSGGQLSSFVSCNEFVEEMIRDLVTPAFRFSLTTSVDGGGATSIIVALGDVVGSVGYSATRRYTVNGMAIEVSLTLRWS